MGHVNTVFNQLLDFIPRKEFESFVEQYQADRYSKKLSCWQQLLCLLYAQSVGKESLRDLETSLKSHNGRWYHLGLETVARSTLADANKKRHYRIFENLFYEILRRCKELSIERPFKFKHPLYALDGSTINLCISLCPWAKFGQKKGGLKIHNLLSLNRQLPEVINLTDASVNELLIAKVMHWREFSDSWIVFDRGYYDFALWKRLTEFRIRFVTRMKGNTNYAVVGQLPASKNKQVLKDERIAMFGAAALQKYPEDLRLVTYWDEESGRDFQFLTNDFKNKAETIAWLYKQRWQIEIFFKWIKQNFVIKNFLGTSQNAVYTQIWVAMIYLLILAFIKHQTGTKLSMLELSRVISSTILYPLTLIDLLQLHPENLQHVFSRASPPFQSALF